MHSRCFKLQELADIVGGEVDGNADVEINGVAGIKEAKTGEITFLANPKYEGFLDTTAASAVIAPPQTESPKPLIRIDNPYYAYLKVLNLFAVDAASRCPRGVHETSVVDPSANIGRDVAIGPHCQIGRNVVIGDNSTLLFGVYVGDDVTLGRDSLVYSNVTIRESSQLGERVILQPGVVIGADGFGFAKDGGLHHKVPQIGRVVIEDDVEIGANSCVDRATTGETRIKRGTKIDNLVQIAHNVVIDEDCIIAAQAGISGSTELGKHVVLAGQAGLVGHIHIGDGAVVGAQGGVTKSVPERTTVSGYPAREHSQAMRIYAHSARLPDMARRLKQLELRLEMLERGELVDKTTKND